MNSRKLAAFKFGELCNLPSHQIKSHTIFPLISYMNNNMQTEDVKTVVNLIHVLRNSV